MSEILSISLTKTQLSDGSWLLYYDGSDIDLSCGTYYLTIDINGTDYFSELFTVKNVVAGVHPELIQDFYHLPLRFYDNILKQNYYKCQNLCDIGLINPIDHIIPYVIDLTGAGLTPTIETKIICHDGSVEYDLSSDLIYTIDEISGLAYQNGATLSGQLFCGVYYLQVTLNGSIIYYSEHFRVENITNVIISNLYLYTESDTPTGFEQIVDEDGNPIILTI